MEKNQQKSPGIVPSAREAVTGGERPGQQLPTGNENNLDKSGENSASGEQHSESSLPESDDETLGTP